MNSPATDPREMDTPPPRSPLAAMLRQPAELRGGCVILALPAALSLEQEVADTLRERGVGRPLPLASLHRRIPPELQAPRGGSPFNACYMQVAETPRLAARYAQLVGFLQREVMGGEATLVERRPMVRFHFPGALPGTYRLPGGAHLTHHSDLLFGDPFGTVNAWLCISGSDASATIQLAPLQDSIEVLDEFAASIGDRMADFESGRQAFFEHLQHHERSRMRLLERCVPVALAPGELLLFDSRMVHATAENVTDHTRVSMDFRLIAEPCHRRWIAARAREGRGPTSFGGRSYTRGAFYDFLPALDQESQELPWPPGGHANRCFSTQPT